MEPLRGSFAAEPDDGPVDLHWYVLTVSPMCEKAVASRLTGRIDPGWVRPEVWRGTTSGRGIATYAPLVRRRRMIGPRRETVDQLICPRYLFVGFAARDVPWLYVREVQGVQGVLGVDGKPVEVEAEMVGGLMWRCESGQVVPPARTIQKGMQIVVSRGVYKGHDGNVRKVRKQTGQVDVVFDMFSTLPVTLPLDDVVSVSYAYGRMTG